MGEGENAHHIIIKLFSSQTLIHIWTKETQNTCTKFIFSAKSVSAVEIFIIPKINFLLLVLKLNI